MTKKYTFHYKYKVSSQYTSHIFSRGDRYLCNIEFWMLQINYSTSFDDNKYNMHVLLYDRYQPFNKVLVLYRNNRFQQYLTLTYTRLYVCIGDYCGISIK